MNSRQRVHLAWTVGTLVVVLGLTTHGMAQQTGRQFAQNGQRQFASPLVRLEDQLKNGLRASRPTQVAFIKQVIIRVEKEQLPREMVNLVFKWAREKNERIPFPYFQFAMRELAKRRGVYLK